MRRDPAHVELRQLALWYVELVLLRFQYYWDDYLVRHRAGHVGDVERVPWPRCSVLRVGTRTTRLGLLLPASVRGVRPAM